MLLIVAFLAFGIFLIVRSVKFWIPPESPAGKRVFGIILKSLMSVFGGALGYAALDCCISSGLALALAATAFLFIPTFILEHGFHLSPRLFRVIRILLYPSILAGLIIFSVYEASQEKYIVRNSEYAEGRRSR